MDAQAPNRSLQGENAKLDRNAPDRVLIHVGFHKTATTWLQRRFFVEENGFLPLMAHQEVHDLIVRPPTLLGDEIAHPPRASLSPSSKAAVISSEILCGNPLTGGREADLYARRLWHMFPGGRVLIVIREQRDAIASTYMQYVRRGGSKTVKQFLSINSDPGYLAFAPQHFEYHHIIQYYISLFGKQNVCVLTFEHFKSDIIDFLNCIMEFSRSPHTIANDLDFGVEAPGDPEALCFLLRRINHFRADAVHPEPVLDFGRAASFLYKAVSFAGRRIGPIKTMKPVRKFVRGNFGFDYGPSNEITRTLVTRPEFMSRYAI